MEANLFTPEEYKKNFVKNKKGKKEEKIQLAFCDNVKIKFPDVIFSCDLSSGMNFPMHIAARNKRMRSSRSHTDFFMAEPRGEYKGFFLELKKDAGEVYCKDGVTFKKKIIKIKKGGIVVEEYDHIASQWEMILKLRSKGYYADFGLGYDDCMKKLTDHLK